MCEMTTITRYHLMVSTMESVSCCVRDTCAFLGASYQQTTFQHAGRPLLQFVQQAGVLRSAAIHKIAATTMLAPFRCCSTELPQCCKQVGALCWLVTSTSHLTCWTTVTGAIRLPQMPKLSSCSTGQTGSGFSIFWLKVEDLSQMCSEHTTQTGIAHCHWKQS